LLYPAGRRGITKKGYYNLPITHILQFFVKIA
jgi:hypothetical protein